MPHLTLMKTRDDLAAARSRTKTYCTITGMPVSFQSGCTAAQLQRVLV